MSSKDDKNVQFPATPAEENKEAKKTTAQTKGSEVALKPKKKTKFSIFMLLGIIVLILISITFIIPGAAFGGMKKNELVFGKYDGESIAYSYDNYFYNQYQNAAQSYTGDSSNSIQAAYTIWRQAYYSTVLHTALGQIAKKTGLITADKVVDRNIISSGYYDTDGAFDTEKYKNTDTATKANIAKRVREGLPTQMIMSDISSIQVSKAETAFVTDMAANGRSFSYVTFDASTYPEDMARTFGESNPQPFAKINASMITAESEEEAKALLDTIKGGKSFADTAKESSKDGLASNGGLIGDVDFYVLQSNFKNKDEANDLFTAKTGSVVGPYESSTGYSLYYLNSAPVLPDFAKSETISSVRSYLSSETPEVISGYLKERADALKASCKDGDIATAASSFGLTVTDVASTAANIGNSQLIPGFSYTDASGALASASADEAFAKQLFTAAPGTILEPQKSGDNIIVVKVGDDAKSDQFGSYVGMYYPYVASSQNQMDLQDRVLTSDKFEDNFMSVFFKDIVGSEIAAN